MVNNRLSPGGQMFFQPTMIEEGFNIDGNDNNIEDNVDEMDVDIDDFDNPVIETNQRIDAVIEGFNNMEEGVNDSDLD